LVAPSPHPPEALSIIAQELEKPECVWTKGPHINELLLSCAEKNTFDFGPNLQTGFKFCPYCGGKIKESDSRGVG